MESCAEGRRRAALFSVPGQGLAKSAGQDEALCTVCGAAAASGGNRAPDRQRRAFDGRSHDSLRRAAVPDAEQQPVLAGAVIERGAGCGRIANAQACRLACCGRRACRQAHRSTDGDSQARAAGRSARSSHTGSRDSHTLAAACVIPCNCRSATTRTHVAASADARASDRRLRRDNRSRQQRARPERPAGGRS